METVQEIRDFDHLCAVIAEDVASVEPDQISLKPYGFDSRIGWDTYLIVVQGLPWGMANGPISHYLEQWPG